MIVDLATEPGAPAEFDVCVAGAGVAGITIALRLVSAGHRVALIEAGSGERSDASQRFYEGENTGVENLPLNETRLRMLGGSSNHWGGWCRPLDPYDLSRSDLTPGGGWPISEADLSPHLNQAAAILGVSRRTGADVPVADADGNLQAIRMMFSDPPARFGERYGEALALAPNLTVFLNAEVTELSFDPAAGRVASFAVRSADGRIGFDCRARIFVLAMGTAENIRTLLIWNGQHGNRIANPDLLGRYYMQHLHQTLGEFVTVDGANPLPPSDGGQPRVFMSSTEKFLRETGVGAFRLNSMAMDCSGLIDQLKGVVSEAFCRSITGGGRLLITCEQMPNADSRISLAAAAGERGRKRARLDWRIADGDRKTLRAAGMEFGRYLIHGNLGRLKINADIVDGETPLKGWTEMESAPGAAGHQMGGIRMGRSPEDGVTDANCRLWATENLYVGGAGVFRTGGHANPTLTLTQLALRLAAEIGRRLSAG